LVYLVLAAALGWMCLRLPTSFLPDEDQGYVVANIELPSGSTATRAMDIIKKVEEHSRALRQLQSIVAVQGFSFNGNGLNSAIAFVPLKDFSQRKGEEDSAQAISAKATQSLLFGLPDSMVFSVMPPPISSLGNASGFDLRLQDRGSQ